MTESHDSTERSSPSVRHRLPCTCCGAPLASCVCWGGMWTDGNGKTVSKTCSPKDHYRGTEHVDSQSANDGLECQIPLGYTTIGDWLCHIGDMVKRGFMDLDALNTTLETWLKGHEMRANAPWFQPNGWTPRKFGVMDLRIPMEEKMSLWDKGLR